MDFEKHCFFCENCSVSDLYGDSYTCIKEVKSNLLNHHWNNYVASLNYEEMDKEGYKIAKRCKYFNHTNFPINLPSDY
jgi:hypothetical protein